MRWTPDTFWSATPREFQAMMDGFAASKGAKPKQPPNPLTRTEFEKLKAKLGGGGDA